MKVYEYHLKTRISRTKEFEKKHLAEYAVNIGLKCGHGCTYCSTGVMLRTHKAFKKLGVSPFENDYAIIDPDTPVRVAQDACRKRQRGLVQLCTTVDAWSPEAQQYQLGRRCLEAILSQPGWTVRILTKNAAVRKDFDVIERYKDRVLVGLSITAPPVRNDAISVIEPNASPIQERIQVLQQAHALGLRTYGMLCPMLPGIADSPDAIDELVNIAVECGAGEIFAEAVNPRGRGLILTQKALESNGFCKEAASIDSVRNRSNWSRYVTGLIRNVQQSVRKLSNINKLRFLLYPNGLTSEDLAQIKQDDEGVIWL
jgi:DNA repair photolyase